jgi:hypothetical protein
MPCWLGAMKIARFASASPIVHLGAGDSILIRVCNLDQTGARAFRQNVGSLSNQRTLCTRFAQPDGPKFEEELGDFENALSGNNGLIRPFSHEKAELRKEDNQ